MNAALEALGEGDRHRVAAGDQVAGAAVRDRGEDRQAERAADLLRRVDQARGQAGLVVLDARHRGDRHRHEREAEADRGQQRREQDVGRRSRRPAETCENQTGRPRSAAGRRPAPA